MPERNHLGQRIGAYGHALSEYPLFCVVTRIKGRTPIFLYRAWRQYRKVRRDTAHLAELRRSAFLVEGLRTCVILSVWDGESGLLKFGTHVTSHHDAIRSSLRHAARLSGRMEIWSSQWRIWSASNNLSWDGTADWQRVFSGNEPVQSDPGG